MQLKLMISHILLSVTLAVTGFLSSTCFAEEQKAQEKKAHILSNQEPERSNGMITWKSSHSPFFSVKFPECWKATTTRYPFKAPEFLKIKSSSKCPNLEQGDWEITFYPENEPLSPSEMIQPQHNLNLNGVSVIFYDKIHFISNVEKLSWTARFPCTGAYFKVVYEITIDEKNFEKTKKDPVVPEVLKKFIQGFSCYK